MGLSSFLVFIIALTLPQGQWVQVLILAIAIDSQLEFGFLAILAVLNSAPLLRTACLACSL